MYSWTRSDVTVVLGMRQSIGVIVSIQTNILNKLHDYIPGDLLICVEPTVLKGPLDHQSLTTEEGNRPVSETVSKNGKFLFPLELIIIKMSSIILYRRCHLVHHRLCAHINIIHCSFACQYAYASCLGRACAFKTPATLHRPCSEL